MGIIIRSVGAERQISVNNVADLRYEAGAALGGENITLTTPSTNPFSLDFDKSKKQLVQVNLPADQVYRLGAYAQNINVDVVGGIISGDALMGNSTGNEDNKSVRIYNASKIRILGARLAQGRYSISATNSTDFEVRDCINEWARADTGQIVDCSRFKFDNWYGREANIVEKTMAWFDDGTLPMDGVGKQATGGWVDITHPDFLQIRGCSHGYIARLDQVLYGAGIVRFGTGAPTNHMHLEYNKIYVDSPNPIDMTGYDIVINDNEVGRTEGSYVPLLQMGRISSRPEFGGGSEYATLVGGRNTADAFSTFQTVPATAYRNSVDLSAAQLTGDLALTEYPVIPEREHLPWGTPWTRPAYIPYTGLVDIVNPQRIRVGNPNFLTPSNGTETDRYYSLDGTNRTNIKVGARLSAGLGSTRGFPAASEREWRWTRNGVLIDGTQGFGNAFRVYTALAGDVGAGPIRVEQRVATAAGTTPWKVSLDYATVVA